MTLRPRDRRALVVLVAVVAVILVLRWVLTREPSRAVTAAVASVPLAEKRLARLKQLAAATGTREAELKRVSAELVEREQGIIQAATAAQAQAQLLQVLRRMGKAQAPPIDIRSVELGQVPAFSENYGETSVSVSFDCRIDQLVQLLADLTSQPELLAPSDLRINAADQKQKTMQVRLTVAGIVPRALVPEKKGATAF